MSILDEILAHKRVEVAEALARVPRDEMRARAERADAPRGFRKALAEADAPAIIAEIKRRSPSKGEIRPDFEPVACAQAYENGGAAALSVLTDESYFGGRLDYLAQVRAAVSLPLLRKDFVVDPYQFDEARAAGADAVLLIVSALAADELPTLLARARALGLDALVEVKREVELDRARAAGADLVGVNNRDLATFEVDLQTTKRLARRLPGSEDVLLVSESGIFSYDDVQWLAETGARAFLVGESLMRQPDPCRALLELRGVASESAGSAAAAESGRNP